MSLFDKIRTNGIQIKPLLNSFMSICDKIQAYRIQTEIHMASFMSLSDETHTHRYHTEIKSTYLCRDAMKSLVIGYTPKSI